MLYCLVEKERGRREETWRGGGWQKEKMRDQINMRKIFWSDAISSLLKISTPSNECKPLTPVCHDIQKTEIGTWVWLDVHLYALVVNSLFHDILKVPSYPDDIAMTLIEEELGQPWYNIYSELTSSPIAAGNLKTNVSLWILFYIMVFLWIFSSFLCMCYTGTCHLLLFTFEVANLTFFLACMCSIPWTGL